MTEFKLTVFAPAGKPFVLTTPDGVETARMSQITYTEEMLERGITSGTLKAGAFDTYRTSPPFVCDWPERFQGLKTAYAATDGESYSEAF